MRLVIFDVDGTLVDSQHEIVEAQVRAFVAHGMAPPRRDRALSVVGLSLHEAFATLAGPDAPIDSLSEAYKAAWTDLRLRPGWRDTLYPGAAEIIRALAARPQALVLGIATGKSRRGVDRILEAQSWHDVFATIQTADDHPSKPDPAMIAAAMAETGIAREDTIMVGDTTYDIEMAVAARVTPIGVAWGYHASAALREAGAAAVVESFDGLRQILSAADQEAAAHDA